ncbi:hypothetical protein BKA69DRAFT_1077177 [Paraphysoderma sedebokerense]|nr:hypothetical protein BKA69DRAFT_1077177 [Paraphysoderma sedebokerense]
MSSYILFDLSSPNTVIDLFQEFDLKRDGFRVGLNLGWALIVTGEEQAGREVVQFLKENDVNGIWQGAIDTWERRVQEYTESKEVSQ